MDNLFIAWRLQLVCCRTKLHKASKANSMHGIYLWLFFYDWSFAVRTCLLFCLPLLETFLLTLSIFFNTIEVFFLCWARPQCKCKCFLMILQVLHATVFFWGGCDKLSDSCFVIFSQFYTVFHYGFQTSFCTVIDFTLCSSVVRYSLLGPALLK